MAVWGTCAGAILMAGEIVDGQAGQEPLALMDITVRRNAYGRQLDSFEADLAFDGFAEPFRGVFIRAPWIESVRGTARGPRVARRAHRRGQAGRPDGDGVPS